METIIETTDEPSKLSVFVDRSVIIADNKDVAVITVKVLDKKRRFVPDANISLEIVADGPFRILGVGNGDPSFQAKERPVDGIGKSFYVKTFNGLAQILVQSDGNVGSGTLSVCAPNTPLHNLEITTVAPQ